MALEDKIPPRWDPASADIEGYAIVGFAVASGMLALLLSLKAQGTKTALGLAGFAFGCGFLFAIFVSAIVSWLNARLDNGQPQLVEAVVVDVTVKRMRGTRTPWYSRHIHFATAESPSSSHAIDADRWPRMQKGDRARITLRPGYFNRPYVTAIEKLPPSKPSILLMEKDAPRGLWTTPASPGK